MHNLTTQTVFIYNNNYSYSSGIFPCREAIIRSKHHLLMSPTCCHSIGGKVESLSSTKKH